MMKRNRVYRKGLYLFLATFLVLSSCGGDNGPTEQEIAEQELSFTWSTGTSGRVTLDGTDVTSFYEDFSITFSVGTYSTRNANGLFQARGTWEWPDQSVTRISLDDGKTLSIINLSGTNLDFSFSFTGTRGIVNDKNSVSGDYRFSLER